MAIFRLVTIRSIDHNEIGEFFRTKFSLSRSCERPVRNT